MTTEQDKAGGMQERLGPRWFDIGEGRWQHEETGRIVEGDDMGPFVDSYPPMGDDVVQLCPACNEPMDWQDCDVCGGEGEYEAFELDPLWYNKDDTEVCHQCGGDAGWFVCVNTACKRVGVDKKDTVLA